MADIRQQAGLDLISSFGHQASFVGLLEEERPLQGTADVATQHFINVAITGANFKNDKTQRLGLEMERFDEQTEAAMGQ